MYYRGGLEGFFFFFLAVGVGVRDGGVWRRTVWLARQMCDGCVGSSRR